MCFAPLLDLKGTSSSRARQRRRHTAGVSRNARQQHRKSFQPGSVRQRDAGLLTVLECTTTGSLVDGAYTAALLLAVGLNLANVELTGLVGGARVPHRPGGGAAAVAWVGVTPGVPIQQLRIGDCRPPRLLLSANALSTAVGSGSTGVRTNRTGSPATVNPRTTAPSTQ